MSPIDLIAILITISALFSYLNHRYLRFPTVIGLMTIAIVTSMGLVFLGYLGFGIEDRAEDLLGRIDFNKTLLHGMLSILLFAGALHINLDDLAEQKWIISSLAIGGVLLSTFMIGILAWWMLGLLGVSIPFIYGLLFGALISPTDPIAVLGILKTAGAPKSLETKITGESLFNDGVGVVVFLVLLELVTEGHDIGISDVLWLFVKETGGGILFGAAIGFAVYRMIKSVDDYAVVIMVTLALVIGGYSLADALHLSGPLAIVVAGLLIGNHGRLLAMSDKTREHLDTFWELSDEIFNTILFVLIGLELLVLTFNPSYLLAGLLMIPIVLLSRFVSVGIPVSLMRWRRSFSPHAVKIMTWGGLRGGISVALALSLPKGNEREIILAITYIVVVFSILVQGLTIGKLIKRAL